MHWIQFTLPPGIKNNILKAAVLVTGPVIHFNVCRTLTDAREFFGKAFVRIVHERLRESRIMYHVLGDISVVLSIILDFV